MSVDHKRLATEAPPPVGEKYDAGKRRFTLLPWKELAAVVDVLEHGAAKYGDHNWIGVQRPRDRYLDAAMRHVASRIEGEKLDPESGLPHLAHAVCSLLFVMFFDRRADEQHAESMRGVARDEVKP